MRFARASFSQPFFSFSFSLLLSFIFKRITTHTHTHTHNQTREVFFCLNQQGDWTQSLGSILSAQCLVRPSLVNEKGKELHKRYKWRIGWMMFFDGDVKEMKVAVNQVRTESLVWSLSRCNLGRRKEKGTGLRVSKPNQQETTLFISLSEVSLIRYSFIPPINSLWNRRGGMKETS